MSELLRALEDSAAARRREILDAARTAAATIAADAVARQAELAAVERSRELADRRDAAEERAASARHSAARRLAEVRRETIDRVMAVTRTRLAGALAAHPAVVDRLVGQALAHLDRPAIARCPPAIALEVTAAIERRAPTVDVAVAVDPTAAAGVVLEARDGSLTVDATLEAVLEQAAAEIEIDLVRRIEGGAP